MLIRPRYLLAGLISVFLVIAGLFGVAGAQNFRSGNNVTVDSSETINSMLWISGRTIEIAGQVNGDVFCAGQNVTVSGTVRGDLLCTAQNITVSGTISGDVRAAAQNVTVSGTVDHSVTAAAQSYTQGSRSEVRGDLSAGANDIAVNGTVGRDAALAGATISVSGDVGRNIKATTQDLQLKRGANIGGNLEYTSEKQAHIESGATVEGRTTRHQPQQQPEHRGASAWLKFSLYILAAGLVTALIIALLFPQALHAISGQGLRRPLRSLLTGLVAIIVVPALIVVLMLTVIGIPLALLLLITWIVIHALSGIVSAYWLGRAILRRQSNPLLIMLTGAVILLVVYTIPILGLIILLLAMLFGIGMILLELNHRRPTPSYNLPPAAPRTSVSF